MTHIGKIFPDGRRSRRGFVFGEMLMGLLLLAVAVSSLAALMYSVSRGHDSNDAPAAVCSTKSGSDPKCAKKSIVPGAAKLLREGSSDPCIGKSGAAMRDCVDSAIASGTGETMVVARTDSASLAIVAKKEKEKSKAIRTDRGFIR